MGKTAKEMMDQSIKKIFEKIYSENLIFALVILGVAGTILEIYVVSKVFILSDHFWYGFLGNILFLNTLHALISYRLLRFSEFREALHRGSGLSEKAMITLAAILFLALNIHFYVIFNKLPLTTELKIANGLFGFFIIGYLRTQHTAYQAYGILQNYNSPEKFPKPIGDFLKVEKFVFSLYFILCVLSLGLFYMRPIIERNENIYFLQLFFAGLAFLVSGFIILRSVRTHGLFTRRTQFSFRFLLMPLKYISVTAAFCNFSCHGVEYYKITRNIEQSCSKKKLEEGPQSKVMTAFLFFAIICFLVGDYIDARPALRAYWSAIPVTLLTAGSQLVSILHFFMDRYFFRFKDPVTRSQIGPFMGEFQSEKN